MLESIQNNPKVFISYSHDSQEHMDRVLALSDRLRADGIDCIIDQYETSPPEGWPGWCENQIEEANFVLVVCTEAYMHRFKRIDTTENGKGAKWEGMIITQELYDSQGRNQKFIPVIFTQDDGSYIPIILCGATNYNPIIEKGYDSIYRHLTNQPLIEKPVLGKLKAMPLLQRKQNSDVIPCNVPFQSNPYFTGREQVLEALHNALKSNKAAALAQAISGLGGIGKTQTAVEYTYKYRKEYEAVLWVKADSCEALISDFAVLAQVLDLPEKNSKEQNLIVTAVRHWLENNSGWLLVFDNADKPELLEDYIPNNPKGHILLTSREKKFIKLGISDPIKLPKMSSDESHMFLIRRTKRSTLPQTETKALEKIAEELDYLPLALEQAGAYIRELECGFSDYLLSYEKCGLKLLQESFPETGKYEKSVATTWLLNFEQVEKTSKAAADLLTASAFFDPDNIPLELIIEGAPELGEAINEALADIKTIPIVLHKLLLPLTTYSLITHNISESTYSINRLVQAVIRDRLGKDVERMWAERTVKAVNRAFPAVEFAYWHLCDRIILHAQAGAELIKKWGLEFEAGANLLNKAGFYQYERGRYFEAETLYKHGLEIPDKSHYSALLNNIALVYDAQGKYVEAEQFYRQALEIHEKSLVPDHLGMAKVINNLAEVYREHGKYAEAEPLCERTLEIFKKSLGSEHPYVATSFNNLAILYDIRGKYAEAEPLYKRALEIYEKSGSDHPNVATSINNLGVHYFTQGKYAEAEQFFRRALEIREKSLGSYHSLVAQSLIHLAELESLRENYVEAEPMYMRALEIQKKSLGSEHPYVAHLLNSLAVHYVAQCKYAEAEPLYKRALEIYGKSLGSDRPNMDQVLNNLAKLYKKQGKYDEVEPLYKHALVIREKFLGSDHPDVAQLLNNLATIYFSQGKYADAEPLYRRALAIREKSLGLDHPYVGQSLNNIAELYRAQGKYADAEPLYRRALAIREKALGSDHTDVATSINNLATLYYSQGKYAEAEPLFTRALEICEKTLDQYHPTTAMILDNYLALLQKINSR